MDNQKQYRRPLILKPIHEFPFVQPGDNISELAIASLKDNGIQLADNDILVFAQKIISKSENRMVNLSSVHPSETAIQLAEETGKKPQLIELILSESKGIIRSRSGLIIAEHRNGFICANAGIDHSNVEKPEGSGDDWVLLLPIDADKSARRIQSAIYKKTGKSIGVLIIDSHGRAWRSGTVGITIGTASVPELVSRIGERDLFGKQLRATVIGAADQLAAGAALVMGEADESIPMVHVRGFPYPLENSSLQDVFRPIERDLFR